MILNLKTIISPFGLIDTSESYGQQHNLNFFLSIYEPLRCNVSDCQIFWPFLLTTLFKPNHLNVWKQGIFPEKSLTLSLKPLVTPDIIETVYTKISHLSRPSQLMKKNADPEGTTIHHAANPISPHPQKNSLIFFLPTGLHDNYVLESVLEGRATGIFIRGRSVDAEWWFCREDLGAGYILRQRQEQVNRRCACVTRVGGWWVEWESNRDGRRLGGWGGVVKVYNDRL